MLIKYVLNSISIYTLFVKIMYVHMWNTLNNLMIELQKKVAFSGLEFNNSSLY